MRDVALQHTLFIVHWALLCGVVTVCTVLGCALVRFPNCHECRLGFQNPKKWEKNYIATVIKLGKLTSSASQEKMSAKKNSPRFMVSRLEDQTFPPGNPHFGWRPFSLGAFVLLMKLYLREPIFPISHQSNSKRNWLNLDWPSQFRLNFTIWTEIHNFNWFTQFQLDIHNFNCNSQFGLKFLFSTEFHNWDWISQFGLKFTISTEIHNFDCNSQFWLKFTISTEFHNFN